MLIVNPNFTIDRTIRLDLMVPGAVHRTGTATTSLGGKGVNVARVARAFGAPGVLIGFLPAFSAAELATLAAAEGAELDGVPIGGTVRAASVLLERSGRVTVFNEPGPTVEDVDWTRLLREVERRAPAHQTVVCSGSLPPGSPVDAYARVIAVARRAGLRSVVDATGEVLLSALAEHPDVVSPNLPEAEALVSGATIEDVEPTGGLVGQRAADAVRGLTDRGAGHAIVSAGSHGAAFSSAGRTSFCPAPEVDVVNPIGAGDSLVGGLVHALENGLSWDDAVPFALAVASASCEQPVAGSVDVSRARDLASGLTAHPIAPTPDALPDRGRLPG
jgi:1-phosphofructokinase family hexose kinase